MKPRKSAHLAWRVALLALVCGLFAGCDGAAPTPYPVSGQVTYQDGTPVEGGMIVFRHKNMEARGAINPGDGRFTLTMIEFGDGADPGEYEVYFLQPAEVAGGPSTEAAFVSLPSPVSLPDPAPMVERQVFPRKYLSPKTSGLTRVVRAEINQFYFQVDRP